MTSSLRSLLVVDDHPLALSGTTTFLAHALPEVQVHAAIGRRQALALVEEGVRPDVVLLDVWLSDCTGFDAMRELRGKLPEARFAFMSAENTPEIVAKAQALGAIGFIGKHADAHAFSKAVAGIFGGDASFPLKADQAAAIKAAYTGTQPLNLSNGGIYLGANAGSPAIGDYRITYELAPLGVVSIVGKQVGSRFEPYQTVAGDRLLMVDTGDVPADKMFAEAVSENTLITWLLRAAGLLLLFIGFALIMAPLGVIFDVIPFLGGIARLGTGIVAFVLAILVGSITIAVAWFWYRPLLAIGIIAAGLVVAFVLTRLGRKAPAPAQAPAAPPTIGRPA